MLLTLTFFVPPGHIVIWHVLDVMESMASAPFATPFQPVQVRPTHYITLHAAPVRSLTWIRTPPISQNGEPDVNQDPTFLASTGYDGSMKLVDTEDIGSSATLIHERGETKPNSPLCFSQSRIIVNLADHTRCLSIRRDDFIGVFSGSRLSPSSRFGLQHQGNLYETKGSWGVEEDFGSTGITLGSSVLFVLSFSSRES